MKYRKARGAANARLIAAAPEMLVLLREAWNRGTAPLPEAWHARRRALLAKIERED